MSNFFKSKIGGSVLVRDSEFKISNYLPAGFLTLIAIFWYLFGVWVKPIFAQTLSISIYPPIYEVIMIPGKSVTQTFEIANNGQDGMAAIYLVPFRPQGEEGSVALDEENIVNSSSPYAQWFSIISPVSNFGEKFYIAGGQTKSISVKLSPPENAAEKDYYFTLIYELDNEIPQNMITTGSKNRARIGANILISLSENGTPLKNPEIVEFSAPKIIDSLGKLDFKIRIGNRGTYVFKTNGQIDIKPTLGPSEALDIAPFNVAANSIRNIPCLDNEEIGDCVSRNKVFLGIYKSTLEISADGSSPAQSATTVTIAFPFSILLTAALIFITYRTIKKNKSR